MTSESFAALFVGSSSAETQSSGRQVSTTTCVRSFRDRCQRCECGDVPGASGARYPRTMPVDSPHPPPSGQPETVQFGPESSSLLLRYFFAPDAEIPVDSHGLLIDEVAKVARSNGTAFRLDDLIHHRFALLIGPPHSGKSFGLDRLRIWLAWRGDGPTLLHTDIKTIGILQPTILPLNWESWRNSRNQGVWCIDALDEASQGSRAPRAIVQALSGLSPEARTRINLLVTCRENELPPQFAEQLQQLLNCECRTLRIAAPSRREAEEICGSSAALVQVLDTIQRSSLQDLAEHPAALRWLAQRDVVERETRAGVWRGVIGELLDQPFHGEAAALSRHEDRFLAAARIAFMLEFGDFDEIRLSGSVRSGRNPSLESLFQSSEERELEAAREAVRSGLFQQLGGNIRIRNRHLREWLAAWQLRELAEPNRWEQIREILGGDDLSDTSGNSLAHLLLEVLAEEARGTRSPELVKWLEERQTRYVENLLSGLLKAASDASFSIASSDLVKRIVRLAPKFAFDVALRAHTRNWGTLSSTSKDLAFWIAEALASPSLIDVAKSSLDDSAEKEAARIAALRYLDTLDEPVDLLATAKRMHESALDRSPRLLSYVLSAGLHKGTISAQDALSLAPRRAAHVIDIRVILEHEIAERLTIDTALGILERPRDYDDHSTLVTKARELLCASLPVQHTSRVAKAVRDAAISQQFEALDNWQRVLACAPQVRRTIYADWVASAESFDLDHYVSLSLQTDDISFLFEVLEQLPTVSERVVTDIYRLARSTPAPAVAVARLRARAESIVTHIEDSIAKSERQMEAIRSRYAREEPARVSLEHIMRQHLAVRTVPNDRLQTIGWLAFGGSGLRPDNIDGTFDSLSDALQQTVLAELMRLVVSVQPTEVPPGNTIPGTVLTEGAAVEEALRRFGAQSFDGPTVAKWFPTLLRLLENDDVIADAARSFPRVAVAEFQSLIEREMLEDSGSLLGAVRAPSDLWGQGLAIGAASLLPRIDLPVRSRAILLDELVNQAPEFALPIAEAWATDANADGLLRSASIRALLQLAPGLGVRALQADVAARGQPALLDIADAFDFFGQRKISLSTWPVETQTILLRLLFQHFPGSVDDDRPPQENRGTGNEDHVIDLRRRLVSTMIEANTAEGIAVLEGLSAAAPRLAAWLRHRAAERRAQDVLDGVPPGLPPGNSSRGDQPIPRRRGLPLAKMLNLIRSGEYRLARTASDLFRVIKEVLLQIATDLADDLTIFFPNGWDEKHSREDVLQAYLCRRLNDLMPGRVIDREAWMRLNRRVDLRVRVQYADLGTSSEVPLEIKWSDDDRTPTAARDQLGTRYMLGSAQTHGLYIVGWSGKSAPVALGESGLKAAIQTNAAEFARSNPAFHIELVWLQIDASAVRSA